MKGFFGIGGKQKTGTPMFDIGADAIQGLINGITSKDDSVIETVAAIARSIPATVVERLRSRSPSRVMFGLGVDLMDGLIDGVESKAAKLEQAMEKIAKSVIKSTKNIYEMGSPSQVFDDIGSNLMTSLAGGAKGASGVVSKTLSSVLGGAFGTGKMSMPVSVSASLAEERGRQPVADLLEGRGDRDKRRQVEEWLKALADKYPEFGIEAGLHKYYLAEAERLRAEFDASSDLAERLAIGRSVETCLEKASEIVSKA